MTVQFTTSSHFGESALALRHPDYGMNLSKTGFSDKPLTRYQDFNYIHRIGGIACSETGGIPWPKYTVDLHFDILANF